MGNWVGWNLLEMPDRLILDQSLLLTALSGLSPIHRSTKDKWGWGSSGVYIVGHGFSALQPTHVDLLTPALGKLIWSSYGLLKITFFSWLLMHQKVLTGENLVKRGFLDPFHCCLCKEDSESSDHLFVDCVFTQSVWKLILKDLQIAPPYGMLVMASYSS